MEDEIDKWDLKQAEWRGYALRALEDMNGEIKDLKKNIIRIEEKLDRVNQRLTNTQIKMASLAGTTSIIVTIVTSIVLNSLG